MGKTSRKPARDTLVEHRWLTLVEPGLRPVVEYYTAVLDAAGLPHDSGRYVLMHPDGRGRGRQGFSVLDNLDEVEARIERDADGEAIPGQKFSWGAGLVADLFGAGSEEAYAARILYQYRRLKTTTEQQDDLGLAIYDALQLGELIAEADLAKDARRGVRFNGGRKRGALDALGRELLEILRGDHKKAAMDVLLALKTKKGTVVETVVRHPRKGDVVKWRDPMSGKVHRTTWRSIRDSRLPRIRRLAKASPSGR